MTSHENTPSKLRRLIDRLQQSRCPKEDYLLFKDFVAVLFGPALNSKIKVLEKLKEDKLAVAYQKTTVAEEELSSKLERIAEYIVTLDQNDPIVSKVIDIFDDDIMLADCPAYLFSKVERILLVLFNASRQHHGFINTIARIDVYIEQDGILQYCEKPTQDDYSNGVLELNAESISPAYNELCRYRVKEYGEMPPWYCFLILQIFHNEVTYEPPVNGEPINAAYNYTERCKILASRFNAESREGIEDFTEKKFAAARLVEYLEAPEPIGLISQSDISFEQVEGRDEAYIIIKGRKSQNPFKGNSLTVLRSVVSDIKKKHKANVVYWRLSNKNNQDIFAYQKGDPLDAAQSKRLRGIIYHKNKNCLNRRIEMDFGIENFIIYNNDQLFVNSDIIEKK